MRYCILLMFLFNRSMSTFFGLIFYLLLDTTSLALENSCSAGTDVAGMQGISLQVPVVRTILFPPNKWIFIVINITAVA